MTDRWIVDASPLILLANAGYEHLLAQLADEVLVPQAVAREVRAGPKHDRARLLVSKRYWKTTNTPAIEEVEYELNYRKDVYERIAASNPRRRSELDYHTVRMHSVLATLEWLKANEERIRNPPGEAEIKSLRGLLAQALDDFEAEKGAVNPEDMPNHWTVLARATGIGNTP